MIEDIRHAKTQQWLITYYVVALLSGVVGFYELTKNESVINADYVSNAFKYGIILIPVVANWILLKYQSDIIRYRSIKRLSLSKENVDLLKLDETRTSENLFVHLYLFDFCGVFIFIYTASTFIVSLYFFNSIDTCFKWILVGTIAFFNIIYYGILTRCKKYGKYLKNKTK